jgi:hypothetical protein
MAPPGQLTYNSGGLKSMGSISEDDEDDILWDTSVATKFSQLAPATVYTAREPEVSEGFLRSTGASLGCTRKLCETKRLKSGWTAG